MANITETNGIADAETECRKWQTRCAELTAERDRLRAELAKSDGERAADLKALYALTHQEFNFTQEEILAQIGKEPPLEQLIGELEDRLEKPV